MAMMVEINNAYSKLSTEDRAVLFYKYAESLDFAAIATELKLVSDDAVRMRHNRAIKKLINRIGGFKPFIERDSSEPRSEEPNEVVESDEETNEDERNEEG